MKNKSLRNILITIFVIVWSLVFHYESLRHFYLNPLFKKELPKVRFLFPPAGWIMFFSVGDTSGHIDVYGVKNNQRQIIDPHDIFRVRTIGYDNIHRGILGLAGNRAYAQSFCDFLNYRFPYFDKFLVVGVYTPEMTTNVYKQIQRVQYECLSK